MCYINRHANDQYAVAQERTAAEWIRLAEEAKEAGMLYLLLTGGEVFLRKDFREVYEALSTMGFVIQIFINGTLTTPEIADSWIVVPIGESVIEFNGLMTLNETGALLWKKLQEGADEGDLVAAILNEYEIDEETATADVREFIAAISERGLLE